MRGRVGRLIKVDRDGGLAAGPGPLLGCPRREPHRVVGKIWRRPMDANDLSKRSVGETAHRYGNCRLCSRLESGLVQPGVSWTEWRMVTRWKRG